MLLTATLAQAKNQILDKSTVGSQSDQAAMPPIEHPLFEHDPRPGGVILLDLGSSLNSEAPKAYWNDKEIAVLNHQGRRIAVIGIPLSTPSGIQTLRRITPDGKETSLTFAILGHAYDEQRITIAQKNKVNPSPIDMERVNRENQRLRRVKATRADRLLAESFVWPVAGPVSSTFGLRRFFNDQPRRPHAGIDIAAPKGTPIVAAANGLVIEAGDYFFNGQSVFIEHGLGLQTFYAHLSRIDVKNGQRVQQGDIIGTVGATGRVTGPHLHWSVGLNSTWIDPLLVIDSDFPPQ